MEAFVSGVLRKILVAAGNKAPVGSLIGVIAEENDDIGAVVAQAGSGAPAAAASEAKAPSGAKPGMADRPAAVPPQPKSEDPAARKPSPSTGSESPGSRRVQDAVAAASVPQPSGDGGRVKASPLARKIAAQSGVDLKLIQGSGPGGRIVRRDVEAASTAPAAAAAAAPAAAAPVLRPVTPSVTGPEYEDVALSPMRAAIAKRMPLSKAPVPHFYVTSEVAMDRGWELREELNGLEGQPKISVNDLIIRACALTLLSHPGVNASFQGDRIRVFHRVHMGIAVALDEGLITPVLRDVHAKPLAQIAVEARDLAEHGPRRKLRG